MTTAVNMWTAFGSLLFKVLYWLTSRTGLAVTVLVEDFGCV